MKQPKIPEAMAAGEIYVVVAEGKKLKLERHDKLGITTLPLTDHYGRPIEGQSLLLASLIMKTKTVELAREMAEIDGYEDKNKILREMLIDGLHEKLDRRLEGTHKLGRAVSEHLQRKYAYPVTIAEKEDEAT